MQGKKVGLLVVEVGDFLAVKARLVLVEESRY